MKLFNSLQKAGLNSIYLRADIKKSLKVNLRQNMNKIRWSHKDPFFIMKFLTLLNKATFEPISRITNLPDILKKLYVNISKYFFLLLFLGFFGSVTLFDHAHVVNGITIVHSHPFKSDKNGIPTHNHTTNGYLIIHLLMNFTALAVFTLIAINLILNLLGKISIKYYNWFLSQSYLVFNPLRGPPAFMLI
jgi:hypothetical protein